MKFFTLIFQSQVLQLFLGSEIHFDGPETLNNVTWPSNMEQYSESEFNEDSDVEISIDHSSKVINNAS